MTHRQIALLRFLIAFPMQRNRPPTATEMRGELRYPTFADLQLDLSDLVDVGVVKSAALAAPELASVSPADRGAAVMRRRLEQLARDCELAELHERELQGDRGRETAEQRAMARGYAQGLRAALALLRVGAGDGS